MSGIVAEAVSELLAYKIYASAAIDATTEPDLATVPGQTGGQILRHVSHTLGLNKDNYRPNEKRQDAQQTMGKHGSRTVPGTINGFLSPGTHKDLFKAVMRSTWAAPIALTEVDLTSAAYNATTGKVTFGGGDPVALGLRVGMIGVFAGLATLANNGKYVAILGFSGPNNRDMEIYPKLTTESADTAFTFTASKILGNPATKALRTDYKLLWEVYNPDIPLSRVYTESRMGGFDLSVGVNDNVKVNFSVLGRNRQVLTGTTPIVAPYLTSPADETTTDIPTSMQGLLRLNGQTLGVVTGLNIKADISPEAAKAANDAGLVAGILLGDFVLSGDFTVFLVDGVVLSAFDNETEMELLVYLPSSKADGAPAQLLYMPRIKINSNNESEVNKAKAIQCQFEAGRYFGNAPGVPSVTLQIADTNA